MKLVSPGVESTRISPPCPATMRRKMSMPRPMPLAYASVFAHAVSKTFFASG